GYCRGNFSARTRNLRLKIQWFDHKGWGAVLNRQTAIAQGKFVMVMAGKLINILEARRRQKRDREIGRRNYIFSLRCSPQGYAPMYAVDAFKFGNESRFFNHSCDPNLSVYMLDNRNLQDKDGVMTMSFWTNRRIAQEDELTFDYTGTFVPGGSPRPPNKRGKGMKK
ncbi:histone H3-K9 methyltransferase KMT1, partial [Mortierella sp. NVP41]